MSALQLARWARDRSRPRASGRASQVAAAPLEMLLQGLSTPKSSRACARPRGGYGLARERQDALRFGEMLARTAMSLSTAECQRTWAQLGTARARVDDPHGRCREREKPVLANLDAITVEQMCETAEKAVLCSTTRGQRRFCYLIPVFARLAPGHGPLGARRRQPQNHVAVALAGVPDLYDPVAQIAIERDPQLPAPALGRRGFIDPGSQRVIGTSCLLAR